MDRNKLENIAFVARAYAKLDENAELPSVYPPSFAKNPQTIYVIKEGKKASPRGLKEDYDLYPFEIFRPYVTEVRRDSQGIYYRLCDEFMALLQRS
jgi:hypothetical protein